MAFERKYMERAIELAKKGKGSVDPNPLVGAVIVKDGKIIGEGYHHKYGDLHAERDAFQSLKESAEGAELYVTMEPCCHQGKQPPCTEALVENKIKRVFVGSDDPNPLVSGKGIWYLREHGVEVFSHAMKEECDELNRVFFHYITTKRPYVVLKYAMTMDGKICTRSGKSRFITNELSRNMVQEMRKELPAIMVGIGTVLYDDPQLTCRIEGARNPIRIIADSNLMIPIKSKVVQTAKQIKTFVATTEKMKEQKKDKIKRLEDLGVFILLIPEKDGHVDLSVLMEKLGMMKVNGILLEGGGTLNWGMLKEGLVQEVRTFTAPKIFGGEKAKTPVDGEGISEVDNCALGELIELKALDKDIYARYILK